MDYVYPPTAPGRAIPTEWLRRGGPPPARVRRRLPPGFTLIEMMVVVFIIGLLATIVSLTVFDSWEKAKRTTAAANIASIKAALRLYKLDHGRYPSTSEGLQKLTEVPADGEESYLERVQNDPWGNEYVYSSDGRQFLLRSLARDGEEGGEGFDADISSDAV